MRAFIDLTTDSDLVCSSVQFAVDLIWCSELVGALSPYVVVAPGRRTRSFAGQLQEISHNGQGIGQYGVWEP
jgi:hypothetical protein